MRTKMTLSIVGGWGSFCGGPSNESATVLGSILGPLIFGNSNFYLQIQI